MSISTASAAARETARQPDGRFGAQAHPDPGQLTLDGGGNPATSTAFPYYPGDDIPGDATVYRIIPDGEWGDVSPEDAEADEKAWLGPADQLAGQLDPGEYTVYGQDRAGRTAEFRVVVGTAPSAAEVAATMGANPGESLTMPDGSTLHVDAVRDMGPAATPGRFTVGVDTSEALFVFESRPDGNLSPTTVVPYSQGQAGSGRLADQADDLAARHTFRADTATLPDGPGRDSTLAQWSPAQVQRWSDTPARDIQGLLRGRRRFAQTAARRPSRSAAATVDNYATAVAEARALGHVWVEPDDRADPPARHAESTRHGS